MLTHDIWIVLSSTIILLLLGFHCLKLCTRFGFLLMLQCPEANIHLVIFTLPRRGGAKLVYACEWNPNAIGALRHNLLVNGVENRCVVLEGDNRLTSPKVLYRLHPFENQFAIYTKEKYMIL